MVQLHWPRKSQFRDPERDFSVTGPLTEDIPDSSEEQYRERGWVDPPDETDSPAPADQAADPDDEGEPEGDSEDEPDADFDPAGFIDRPWQAVKAAIQSGEADGHLDEVREAESNRDGNPRGSVIGAIEERQQG